MLDFMGGKYIHTKLLINFVRTRDQGEILLGKKAFVMMYTVVM